MREYSDLKFRKIKNGHTCGYMYYRDADGKRRQVSKVSKETRVKDAKRELRAWAAEKKRQAAAHPVADDNELTIEEVITAFLQEQRTQKFLEESTYYSQLTNAKKNIFPYIGQYVFNGTDNLAISGWLSELAKRGLTQSTIHSVYSIVSKTYNHFFFTGDISYNPCSHVKTPKKGQGRITFLDADQLDKLILHLNEDYAEGSHLWTAVNLAVLAGLRRGEICGLRFHDIDLERKTLTVETAIGITQGGTYPKDPKNKNSARTFSITDQLAQIIQIRRDYVTEKYGTIDNSWFVIGETINYKPPTTLSNEFKKFVHAHEIVDHYGKEITLHSLRHNIATLGVRNNVDVASMANMLGHTRTVMLETYAAADPAAMKVAADTLTKAFDKESESYGV